MNRHFIKEQLYKENAAQNIRQDSANASNSTNFIKHLSRYSKTIRNLDQNKTYRVICAVWTEARQSTFLYLVLLYVVIIFTNYIVFYHPLNLFQPITDQVTVVCFHDIRWYLYIGDSLRLKSCRKLSFLKTNDFFLSTVRKSEKLQK